MDKGPFQFDFIGPPLPSLVRTSLPFTSKEISEAEIFYGVELFYHHDTYDPGPRSG